jgi:hypothetical protein
MWNLNMVGPLQQAPGGFMHLLVVVDKFSKWIEARPIVKVLYEEAVAFFTDIIFLRHTKHIHHRQWHPIHEEEIPELLR